MIKHIFDIDIAKQYGIEEAILFENIAFWVEKSKANDTNFFEGKYWTFNSIKAFAKLFPYMTERRVRYALDNLVKHGLIEKGNFNKIAYDRTRWYALTEKGESIRQNGETDLAKLSNGLNENGEPIPDINTDINTDINSNDTKIDRVSSSYKRFIKPTIEEIAEYCKSRNNDIDAESFYNFYQSKGWKVGNTPMKDWKACVITWEKRNRKESGIRERIL